jgi:hypothetical protein
MTSWQSEAMTIGATPCLPLNLFPFPFSFPHLHLDSGSPIHSDQLSACPVINLSRSLLQLIDQVQAVWYMGLPFLQSYLQKPLAQFILHLRHYLPIWPSPTITPPLPYPLPNPSSSLPTPSLSVAYSASFYHSLSFSQRGSSYMIGTAGCPRSNVAS